MTCWRPVQVSPELLQHLSGHTFALTDQAQEDVLGPDVVVAELEGLPERKLQDLLGSWREGDVAGGGGLPLADDLRDLGPDGVERDPQGFQGLGGHPLTLVDEAQEDVLGPDVVVVEHPRLFLARTTTRRALSVNRSNISPLPPGRHRRPPSLLTRGSLDPVLPPRHRGRPRGFLHLVSPGAPSVTHYTPGVCQHLPKAHSRSRLHLLLRPVGCRT